MSYVNILNITYHAADCKRINVFFFDIIFIDIGFFFFYSLRFIVWITFFSRILHHNSIAFNSKYKNKINFTFSIEYKKPNHTCCIPSILYGIFDWIFKMFLWFCIFSAKITVIKIIFYWKERNISCVFSVY